MESGWIQKILDTLVKYEIPASGDAVMLLFRTGCHESHCGEYLTQIGGGPARGFYQIEGPTHDDLWDNYIDLHPEIKNSLAGKGILRDVLRLLDFEYSTVMARLCYMRHSEQIPPYNDINGQYYFYKKYFNGHGKATLETFVDDYNRYKQYA